MAKRTPPIYAYYSHNHAVEPGCPISVYRTPSGREVVVTKTGPTPDPKDSGYTYPQTIRVGRMNKKWQLLRTYKIKGPADPEYLLDPEEELDVAA
jgi:hypothetical protein